MQYETICESNKVEVLKHFIRIEATRSKYVDKREEMMGWICLDNPDEFIQEVRNFEKTRKDENPAILWTIGTEKDPVRPHKIRRWILAKVDLRSLYTLRINSKINPHLDLVNGNLERFVRRGYPAEHDEFHTSHVPTNEKRVVIGIAHFKENRDGEIEIVDGCHRAIAMLTNEIRVFPSLHRRIMVD